MQFFSGNKNTFSSFAWCALKQEAKPYFCLKNNGAVSAVIDNIVPLFITWLRIQLYVYENGHDQVLEIENLGL